MGPGKAAGDSDYITCLKLNYVSMLLIGLTLLLFGIYESRNDHKLMVIAIVAYLLGFVIFLIEFPSYF